MVTTQVATIRQTGFKVGTDEVRFGLLWPDGGLLMTPWNRDSKWVDLDGANLTVTQLLGFKPRRVTYRVFFETIAEKQALDALTQETGTLALVHGGHTVEVDNDDQDYIFDRVYDKLPNVTLLALVELGVDGEGVVECEALFQVSS